MDEDWSRDLEWKLFPQSGYEVVTDETLKPVSLCPAWDHVKRNASFFKKGMRHTAAAVMITHRWRSPHLLVFLKQSKNTTQTGGLLHCGLFSVKYKASDNPKTLLMERLSSYLRPTSTNMLLNQQWPSESNNKQCTATIGDYLGTWWVASANDYSHPLPYIPAHTTRPREMIRLYQVVLPPEVTFCVTPGYTLKSIPLFDLVAHRPPLPCALQRIPFMISRFVFTYYEAGEDDEVVGGRSIHETVTAKPAAASAASSGNATAKKSVAQSEAESAAQKSQVQLLSETLNDEIIAAP